MASNLQKQIRGKLMTTEKQRAANRRNAAKSTGPRTSAGKAASSMNRLRDGLYSSTLILPGENQAEFDQIRAGYQDLYQPRDAADQQMVDQLAAIQWKMRRTEVIEAGVLIEHGDDPAGECLGPYDRVMRIHGRLHRAWFKLYKELESIKAARKKELPEPHAVPELELHHAPLAAAAAHQAAPQTCRTITHTPPPASGAQSSACGASRFESTMFQTRLVKTE
jgi:hypothetical protein